MCAVASVVSGGGVVVPDAVDVPAVPAAMMIAKARDSRSIRSGSFVVGGSDRLNGVALHAKIQATERTGSLYNALGRRVLIIA